MARVGPPLGFLSGASPIRFRDLPHNALVDDKPPGKPSLEVGTLSPDGSRIWTGRFWAVNPARTPPRDDYTPSFEGRPAAREVLYYDQRGYGCAGMIAAVVCGVGLSHFHITLPIPAPEASSAAQAVSMALVALALWQLAVFGSMVLCLSIARQGIDVLLLRSMVVGAIYGGTLLGTLPLDLFPGPRGYQLIGELTLGGAVTTGPILALLALALNLIWYRSFRSLRPQLPIFNRSRVRVGST